MVLAEERRDVTTMRRSRMILDAGLGTRIKKHLRAFLWFIPFTQPSFGYYLHLTDALTPEMVLWEKKTSNLVALLHKM